MKDTVGMRVTMTNHACKVAAQKGITADVIKAVFENPVSITPNDREGQYRVQGIGLTLVGAPVDENRFHVITLRKTS